MKIQRPSPGRIVLVHEAFARDPLVAVVIMVDEADPLLVAVSIVGGAPLAPTIKCHYLGKGGRRWSYPPREDRTIDVPEGAGS